MLCVICVLRFKDVLLKRTSSGDAEGLAAALSGMSPGRAPSMWDTVRSQAPRFLTLAGSSDTKFRAISQRLASLCGDNRKIASTNGNVPDRVWHIAGAGERRSAGANGAGKEAPQADAEALRVGHASQAVVVEGCGHAVHIESPLALLHEILRFIA